MSERTRTNSVTASVAFEPTWMPRMSPDPRVDVATLRQQAEKARESGQETVRTIKDRGHKIYEWVARVNREFRTVSPYDQGSPDRKKQTGPRWKWYDARYMIATALGAAEPGWDGNTTSWWMDREQDAPLSWVESEADVARIPVPEWRDVPYVQRMLESRERWQVAFPDAALPPITGIRLNVPGGKSLWFVGSPSFIDLGIFLLGTTRFLTMVGGEPQLAQALMEKCFELSTSYSEFVQSLDGDEPEALIGFAGDVACLLSPQLYEKYSVGWDVKLLERFKAHYSAPDDTPCNLHSCGPSAHLYPSWGQHPLRDNIQTMQTRLLPAHVRELRQNLPHTYLQLTFHPQHYDFARVTPQEVRSTLRQAVRDAEARDVHFVVYAVAHAPEDVGKLETTIEAFYEELVEINQ